jgi:uncharacterized protein (TIGR00369 family)
MSFPDGPGPFHHAGCLGCGTANPNTMGIHVRAEGGRVVGHVRFDEHQAGAPGFAHGGAVATVLDDALGSIPLLMGTVAVTANLSVDYRAPVLLGTTLDIAAWPMRSQGRKFFVAGELREPDGKLVAEATALFVVVEPEHFERGTPPVGRW